MVIRSTSNSGIFPRRIRNAELRETNKEISFKKIPETIDEFRQSRTVRNEELDITLQSEAFDVGFGEPDPQVTRRLNVF